MIDTIEQANIDLPRTLAPFVWRYLKNRKLYIAGFILIAIIWAIEMSLSPYLVKHIIDTVIQYPKDPAILLSAVMIPAALYISMSIIINLTFRFHDYLNLRLFPEIQSSVIDDMYAYLMRHSYTFFQNNFAGSLTKKISDMATSVERIISIIKVAVIPRILALLICSGTLFAVVQPIFGVILFVWTLIFVYLSYIIARRSERIARELSENAAKMNGVMSDSISNAMSIKLFSNIHEETLHLSKSLKALVASDRKLAWENLKANLVHGSFITLLIAAMLIALINGRIHGTVTPGDFALVLMLCISFIMSLEDLRQRMMDFTKVVGNCNQAMSFIQLDHGIKDQANAQALSVKTGTIKFDHVAFQYENNDILFSDLNVKIKPGEHVGLVGYSGGGKSTFVKLILRLIDIRSGTISIDDQDIRTVTKDSLRKQIGMIPQDPDLFHRSIMENIRFAKPNASDEEVILAAKQAKCHDFICELPDQYQSLVGERGIKLSGGQKQRIAIARAFVKNAPILLLDEATSALDSITERHIQESLHDVMQHRTTIVIAHRLSTLKDMDRILVFVHGKIVQDGSLDQLLQDTQGHFYKLWQMQTEGFIPSIRGDDDGVEV